MLKKISEDQIEFEDDSDIMNKSLESQSASSVSLNFSKNGVRDFVYKD